MSRKFVLVALACGLVLFSFVVSFPLFASSSDVPATPIKKAAIIYGFNWNSQSTSYVASNYDLLIVDFNGSRSDFYIPYAYWMSDLKIKSGSIQIYGYKDLQYMASYYDDWAEVNTHEDWFVHDDLGNRITNPRWGTYLMDVGNDGWRQHYLSYVNQKLSDCPSYSGVFADDVGDTLYPESFNRAPNAATVDRWHADTLGMLQYVDANLVPGKSFIINTESGWAPGHVNSDYINVVDGMLIEGYYHAPWEDSSSYSKVIESQLNCLSSWSSKGKIMIAGSGSAAEDSRILKWTYSTFLLGVDGSNTYWSWNIGSSYTFDPEYHAITNTNLGSPIGSYYLSQDVYMRNFTGGLVLANPSRNPHTIDLGISFWLLNNTQVSSFTLGAYSGEVLLNEPVPTPTPTPSPTPSPSPSPTPTFSPTPSPTPTRTPSPTPTRSPTLSPTVKPTNSPTVSPPTSISPTPTLTAPPSKKPTTPSTSKSPTLLPSPSSSSISREGNSSIPTSLLYVGTSVAIVVVVCAVFVRKDFRKALGKRFPFIHR